MQMRMNYQWLWLQFKANIVAIVSVIVALSGLAYNTWRNEKTEINRNVRVAAFETLKNLGEAEIVVEYVHFRKARMLNDPLLAVGRDPLQGRGRMIYIRDLAQVLPAPGPEEANLLYAAWRDNADKLETDTEAMIKITDEIQRLRLTTLDILRELR